MFSFSTKPITTYAFTGGFFIFVQLLFLFYLIIDNGVAEVPPSIKSISEQFTNLAPAIQSALTSLLVAVALLSIFFFGVIVDLIGSLYVAWELRVFSSYVKRNKSWLIDYMKGPYGRYVQDDLTDILTKLPDFDVMTSVSDLQIWRKSVWVRSYQGVKALSLLPAKQRAEQILTLHALAAPNPSFTSLINERLELCRFSRAIATTLVFASTEFGIYSVHDAMQGKIQAYSLLIIICLFFTVLAIFMTIRAYSRLCLALFAMVYTRMYSEQDQNKIFEKREAEDFSTHEKTNSQEP
jgi:hypothetical protein